MDPEIEQLLDDVAKTYLQSLEGREAFEAAVQRAYKKGGDQVGYETISKRAVDATGKPLSVGSIRRIVKHGSSSS